MIVSRKSAATGIIHEMDLPITQEELDHWQATPTLMIQDAFPQLTADEREFIMSGVTPEEWDELFDDEEDEDDYEEDDDDFLDENGELIVR